MPKLKPRQPDTRASGSEPAAAPVIHPNAVFTLASAAAACGLPSNCLPREIRLGRLQARRRGGRYYILGQWLLEWLATGETHRSWRGSQPEGPPVTAGQESET